MRVAISKGPGGLSGRVLAADEQPKQGEVLDDTGNEMLVPWMKQRVWDDATNSVRLPTSNESLEAKRTAKRKELEAAFATACQTQFDQEGATALWVFLGVYMTNQNDARISSIKGYKTNLDTKTTALADLGKPGKAPLTEANISAIVW